MHGWANFESFRDYDALRKEVIRELLVERQVEPDSAAADIERPVFDIRVGLQYFLEIINHLARCVDRRPLRERQVDKQLGTVGAREELLLHELHAGESGDEQRNGCADHPVFQMQHSIEHGVERPSKARRLMAVTFHLVGQDENACQRREQHRDEPGSGQCNADHCEQGEGVLAGTARCEADRNKPCNGDEGSGQHRKGSGSIGKRCRGDLVAALLELLDHHLHRDHGVVNEEPEPDDERAERDALQADSQELHRDESDGENQRDRNRDDDARAPTEREETHG